MKRLSSIFAVASALVVACGSDPSGNAQMDAGSTDSGTTPMDAGSTDSGTIPMDAGSTDSGTIPMDAGSTDSGTTPMDAGSTDSGTTPMDAASTDSGTTPMDAGSRDSGAASGATKGQCYTDAHCGSGKTCVATAPGGFCSGCADTCSLPAADQCNFGTCNGSCATDAECPGGLRCNAQGTCILRSCSTDAVCGPLHSCQGGFCRRIPCSAGCPAGTACKVTSTGSLCVENNLSF